MRSVKGKWCNKCQVEDLTNQTFAYLTPISYVGQTKDRKALWLCKCKCGNEIIISASNLKTGNSKSCGCLKESAGEMKIREILEQQNIKFETQKTFETCRFISTNALARFDFYLPEYHILIEYDGIQHFIQRNNWEKLEDVQKRDNYKTQWCKENNISLIRIPYTDYIKLSKEYLLSLIKSVL